MFNLSNSPLLDGENLLHLGSNIYALKHPRTERVTLESINKLRGQVNITQATQFIKEGYYGHLTQRIGSKKVVRDYPALAKALRLKNLDPMDYVLIRFGS